MYFDKTSKLTFVLLQQIFFFLVEEFSSKFIDERKKTQNWEISCICDGLLLTFRLIICRVCCIHIKTREKEGPKWKAIFNHFRPNKIFLVILILFCRNICRVKKCVIFLNCCLNTRNKHSLNFQIQSWIPSSPINLKWHPIQKNKTWNDSIHMKKKSDFYILINSLLSFKVLNLFSKKKKLLFFILFFLNSVSNILKWFITCQPAY